MASAFPLRSSLWKLPRAKATQSAETRMWAFLK
jgi:hypothetical protein